MPAPVNAQKIWTEWNCAKAPTAMERMSAIDVMVTARAASAKARPMRSSTVSRWSVWRHAAVITKVSSTPTPATMPSWLTSLKEMKHG